MSPAGAARGPGVFAAVDLGATSGRVVLGRVGPDTLDLTEVHRFPNSPLQLPGGLHWDVPALRRGVTAGLRAAARAAPGIRSLGIDTWAVDYGLLGADGRLLGPPFHYRDARTEHLAGRIHETADPAELYRANGLQHLPFTTLHQLTADRDAGQLALARRLLLMPDLLTHHLTGTLGAEVTNASTTGLLDIATGGWNRVLAARFGIPPGLLPPLRHPGDPAGTLLPDAAAATGLPPDTPVTTVASHDTASAVAAVPATTPDFAYLSCGTWSLAGLELDAPVLSEESRAANFTNERGIDGTVRYLRNIMGLWLLEECRRDWSARGAETALPDLLADAARARPFASLVPADSAAFLAPGDMPARLAAHCAATGQQQPATRGEFVRCILESLALGHRRTLRTAAALAGREITRVHLVGGGSRNPLLCQLTADATGLPVIAGPAEATAIGNVLVQARAHGLVVGGLPAMRELVSRTQPLRRYDPSGEEAAWAAAERRVDSR